MIVTATKNENSIAIEAFAGIGLMYGPIRPLTNIIGNGVAAIVIARWEGALDRPRLAAELAGEGASFRPRDGAVPVR